MYCAGVLTFDGGFMDSSSSRTKCITARLKTSQRQGLRPSPFQQGSLTRIMAKQGSFAPSYPLSPARVDGVAYTEGKSDTPRQTGFARVEPECDFAPHSFVRVSIAFTRIVRFSHVRLLVRFRQPRSSGLSPQICPISLTCLLAPPKMSAKCQIPLFRLDRPSRTTSSSKSSEMVAWVSSIELKTPN